MYRIRNLAGICPLSEMGKRGTKWRKYMKTCMFPCHLVPTFTTHYIIMVKGLLMHEHQYATDGFERDFHFCVHASVGGHLFLLLCQTPPVVARGSPAYTLL